MINRIDYRNPLEVLAEEFTQRCRTGEAVSIEEYAIQHGDIADDIRQLFPLLMEMELLRSSKMPPDGSTEFVMELPNHLGDYEILREIGRGAMGVVYEAQHHALGRRVAVKVFPHHSLEKPHQLERFLQESRTTARLHHTNIVPVFGVGEQDGLHFYVMQRIDGITLEGLIGLGQQATGCAQADSIDRPSWVTEGPASGLSSIALEALVRMTRARIAGRRASRIGEPWWTTVAELGMQVSRALAYAHDQGVIHGDIKPSNLILDEDGTIWVTDFGLAKALRLPQTNNEVAGTLRFMSPEHLAGEQSAASDLYALGLTLYELATLEPAFRESDPTRLAELIAHGAMERPRGIAPEMPADLEAIIMKASARDEVSRYVDAQALADDLARFLEGKTVHARPIGIPVQTWRWMRRNPLVATLSTVLLLVVVSSFALISARWHFSVAENRRAESNLSIAIMSIDRILDRFTSTSVAHPTAAESIDGEAVSSNHRVRFDVTDRSVEALHDALFFYNQFSERNPRNPHLRSEIVRVHRLAGDIHERLGQYSDAADAYRSALAKLQWDSVPVDTEVALFAATTLNRLGSTLYSESRYAESEAAFLRAQGILSADPHRQDFRCQAEQARTFTNLGQTQWRMRKGHHAKTSQRRSVGILERLTEQHPTDLDLRLALAIAYRRYYPLVTGGSEHSERIRVSQSGISILSELAEEFPEVLEYQYELCETLITNLPGRGSSDERRAQLNRGLAIATELAEQHSEIPRSRVLEADALRELARIEPNEVADHLFVESIAVYHSLAHDFPSVPVYHVLLAKALQDRADGLVAMERPCEALECLLQGAAEQQAYVELRPSSRFGRKMLDRIHRKLGHIARMVGFTPTNDS